MGKESSANDEVLRAMQLEQERFARLERSELAISTGLPKVELVQLRLTSQKAKPVVVGDGHVKLQVEESLAPAWMRLSWSPAARDPTGRHTESNFMSVAPADSTRGSTRTKC